MGINLNTTHVYNLEPFFYLRLSSFAYIGYQLSILYQLSFVYWQRLKLVWLSIKHYRKLAYKKSSDTCYTLLSIKHFKLSIGTTVEIEQTKRILFQQRVDNSNLLYSILLTIEIITLIFWLNSEFSSQSVESLAVNLAKSETLAKFFDCIFL